MRVGSALRLLAVMAVLLPACSGTRTIEPSPFAGTYSGTWTALNDPSDTGTSVWTITASGSVTGTDTDPGRGLTFTVVGLINPQGQLTSTATPSDASGASSLNGTLTLETSNRLAGTLVWGTQPPASYRYVLNR